MPKKYIDLSVISNVDWDEVVVRIDGTILTTDGDELDLDDVLAAFQHVGTTLKRMVAATKGEEVEA